VSTVKGTSDLWWKNAVVYCLDVERFLDWNDDGVGDFAGLTQRVDYLAGIGVTCIWLMPFYPSPNRDDGYDITDYYSVDPRLGTLGDFVEFMRTATDRGIRVIADLVVNHTSDQHPWFRAARSSRTSPYRDFYVWADEPPKGGPEGVTFPDEETSLWELDPKTGQYYLHRFYKHQPDLNVANPKVRDEIAKIIGFWLELGLSGFRVDAVPFLLEESGAGPQLADPHDYLRDLRAFLSRRRGDAILLGEVNLAGKEVRKFFGDEDGDELTMCFDFVGMQAMYLALARQDARPLERALERLPAVPADAQWANFVRNHDELTLDKLSEKERAEVFAAFGPDPDMQLFGRGLRRRLPSMLGGDLRRIKLVYSLLFSKPGTPVLFYGEEIGMAENLDVPGRLSVRTPMQWSDEKNAGFSTAAARRLPAPLVEGEFGPMAVNVARERRDADSLLNWFERVIRRRKESPEIGWGTWALVPTAERSVFAHRCDWQDSTLVAVHNFSPEPVATSVSLDVPDCEGLTDLLGDGDFAPTDGRKIELKLDGYGFKWLRVRRTGQRVSP
jgi:trehalose synthase